MKLLTEEFLSQYPDMPEHITQLGMFVFYRTYSRWLDDKKRRETWKEVVERSVEYNVSISIREFEKNGFVPPINGIRAEAERLFDNIFNLKQFLAGRTHWVGGADTKVADKFPLANFNCSFIDVTKWDDIVDLFYLLMVGTGVGVRCTKENAMLLPTVRVNYTLQHSEYNPVLPEERLEHTKVNILPNGYAKIYIGDSKEGWCQALDEYFKLITKHEYDNIECIKISYNSIRPKGERLKTFGGTASGHETLKEMFEGIDKIIKNKLDSRLKPLEHPTIVDEDNNEYIDKTRVHVRPIHVLDIVNLIGNNVVVGGVRRTSEIFLCDSDDEEVINAKSYITPDLSHRYMSNNSIVFNEKPTREKLHEYIQSIKINGEPGLINMEAISKRRPNARGVNPCGEVLLDSYGVCNLTTINVLSFVKENEGVAMLDYSGLMEAQALSVRAGIRMTCLDLELSHWNKVHKRDRLIGCSMTGWQDAMGKLGYTKEQEQNLLELLGEVAYNESVKYSHILRIPTPLLNTTIKPEGTLSQVAGGVSSGLHTSYAPYYIRRIRINSHDPLVKVVKKLNWRIHPEVGQDWETANTLVIDFPVKSSSVKTRKDITIDEQFENYLMFQEYYTDHNSSNTMYVRDDEWDRVEELIWEHWDEFIGVTFLPYDGGNYELMPYEECSEEEYNNLLESMLPFDSELLFEIEKEETMQDLDGLESCDGGVCPII